jgi:putative ABC transport system permease protein
MSALSRVVRSGVGRRRVPTIVIGLATMMAVTATVLAAMLLVASNAPFTHAFDTQRGAHLVVRFDAQKVTAEQLAATAHAAGVTAAAGPFAVAALRLIPQLPTGGFPDDVPDGLPPLLVAGRSAPGTGPVDAVSLISGRWPSGPGEIVLNDAGPIHGPPSTRWKSADGTIFTVVGTARSVSQSAEAWVTPEQLAQFHPTGSQMLYRFGAAGSADAMRTAEAAVAAQVPGDALLSSQSWLDVRAQAERRTAVFVPLLIAFGLLGLAMSMLIIGNVVAGSVSSGVRRIGILKALGFTPRQVVRAYVSQALLPGAVGTALGVVAGNLLAIPLLSDVSSLYGVAPLSASPVVDVCAAVGALLVIAAAALAAAARAGRLRPVDAIAVGRTPKAGRGRRAARLAGRTGLPRAVSLGLAHPFARPARATAMLVTVAFGAIAVTFAIGLSSSLRRIEAAHDRPDNAADVTVPPRGPRSNNAGVDVLAAIKAQPGTDKYYGARDADIPVNGLAEACRGTIFSGDASWSGYVMMSGRWFTAPGEAVVAGTFLDATGTHVGDTVVSSVNGTSVRITIVGEAFTGESHPALFTNPATVAPLGLATHDDYVYSVKLRPGTDTSTYITALQNAGVTAEPGGAEGVSSTLVIIISLTTLLTLMLIGVAALGVLNAVVLDTRERVHDIGVHKAIGMTPRQTIVMVLSSVLVAGVLGGAIGTPAGFLLQHWAVPAMGRGAGVRLPPWVVDTYGPGLLTALASGGVLIAVIGALLPAGWAARTRTATALRTE